jgi:probable rRNA maturation factor
VVQIEILDETGRFRARKRLRMVLERVGPVATRGLRRDHEWTLVLVDDATIARRNLADRAVDGPTDVLAYPLMEPDDRGIPSVGHLGDVIVSLDTAARQARARGVPMWHEVAVLASHGLLHLLGWDHQTSAAWPPFEALQQLAGVEAVAVDTAARTGALLRAQAPA